MGDAAPPPGSIGWIDLTSEDAETLKTFYSEVVGWLPHPVEMDGYADWAMVDAATGEARTGICHRRGVNAGQPGGWIVYFLVRDLDAALERVRALGGEQVGAVRGTTDRFCLVRDPSGALCALYQKAPSKA